MKFCHYSGCGNDFIIKDDRDASFPIENNTLIQNACSHAGVDGLILVQRSDTADFRMRFFNNDGKEASMCGNGLRCFFQFIREKLHFSETEATIQTQNRLLHVEDMNGLIRVEMGVAEELGWNIKLEDHLFHHINTGVPHIVTVVDDVEKVDVNTVGAHFRSHARFGKQGTNVNFVDPKTFKIRTFERGVEGETLACGTGATATAYALHKIHNIPSPITLQVRSQEHLTIDILENQCTMTGPATFIQDISYVA